MATNRTTVNVSITPELNAFLQSRVQSGRYQTTSEVVREALRLLERHEREREDQEAEEELEALALEGLHSGDPIEVGPGYWEEKHRRLQERLKKTGIRSQI